MSVEASKFSNYIEFERIICLPPAFVNSTEPTLNASLRPIIAHHRHNWYFWSCMAYVNIYNGVKLVTFFLKFLGLRYRYCAHPEHAIGTEDLNTRLISDLNQPRIMVNEKSYRFKRIAEHLHPPIFGTQSIKGLQDLCTDNGVKVSLRLGIPLDVLNRLLETLFGFQEQWQKLLADRMLDTEKSENPSKKLEEAVKTLIILENTPNRCMPFAQRFAISIISSESIRHTRAVLENDTFKDYQYSLEHHFIAASKLRSLVRRQIKRYI